MMSPTEFLPPATRAASVRLAMGKIPRSKGDKHDTIVFASETCAFDLIGAEYVRDVKPGEFIVVGPEGVSSRFYSPAGATVELHLRACLLFAPDSLVFGRPVQTKPRGTWPAARAGSAGEMQIWWSRYRIPALPRLLVTLRRAASHSALGLIRNHYVGRTFIEPSQSRAGFRCEAEA